MHLNVHFSWRSFAEFKYAVGKGKPFPCEFELLLIEELIDVKLFKVEVYKLTSFNLLNETRVKCFSMVPTSRFLNFSAQNSTGI